jgi:hypothetical protein
MKKITQEQLNEILKLHKLWLLDNTKGQRADLSNADFRHADFSYTNLSNANFSNTNLSNANFNYAYLDYANFSNANLKYANFSNTNLSNAYLNYANFSFAKNIIAFQKLNGRMCYAVKHTNCIMIQAGCFWNNINEFEKQAIEEYGNDIMQNYQPQIQYLKSIFTI